MLHSCVRKKWIQVKVSIVCNDNKTINMEMKFVPKQIFSMLKIQIHALTMKRHMS